MASPNTNRPSNIVSLRAGRLRSARVAKKERIALFAFATLLSLMGSAVVCDIFRHRAHANSQILLHLACVGAGVALVVALSHSRIQWSAAFLRPMIVYCSLFLAFVYLARELGLGSSARPMTMLELGAQQSAAFRVKLTRLAFPLAAAHILSQRKNGTLIFGRFLLAVLLSTTWGLFLIRDAGTGPLLSFIFIATIMAWLAGLRTAHVAAFLVCAWSMLLAFLIAIGRPHWERLAYFVRESWLPSRDPLHIVHAVVSIARGGIFGVGLGNVSLLTYALPTAESRHVFAVLGQEFGLAGCLFVLALFVLMLLRGLHVAEAAFTTRAQVGAAGIIMTLALQAFHHIAFNCALSPTVGTPLPFLSAGAPNILFSWAALGLLLSASQRLRRHESTMIDATDEAPDAPLWKPRRRGILQLLFVIYALFLVGRLCVIATDERLERAALFHFERTDETTYSRSR